MLRHYEKLDLLIPNQVDQNSGFRYYCAAQLETVNKIQKLKSLGFSLAIIKEMLSKENISNLKTFFDIRERELKEELSKIAVQSKQLDSVKTILKENSMIMNYNVILKEIPERKVISLRKVIQSYSEEGKLWSALIVKQNIILFL